MNSMMQATDFEFCNRWWIFGAIFGASFFPYAFEHTPVGVMLAKHLAVAAHWSVPLALHAVFGISAAILVAAAMVRTWGSAYLGRDVVHGAVVHAEAFHAAGPYRHVRNPLYLGNVLMSFALALLVPEIGLPLMLLGIPMFCYRLIGREEAALETEQGERYSAFLRAVPRLFPSVRARIPASASTPDWIGGLSAEAFFWSYALGLVGFAIWLNPVWFYGGLILSPLVSWLAGRTLGKRGQSLASAPRH